ncbi:MAG TPA: hypothetical protein VM867_12740 [Xanthobacteraceae bacterium]|nr:hypothetical protein [Xanthobacteraceae bacterium]
MPATSAGMTAVFAVTFGEQTRDTVPILHSARARIVLQNITGEIFPR